VLNKFGVLPCHLVYWLAFVGDKSDNVPGVPGIGPKMATALIEGWNFNDLIERLEEGDSDELITPAGTRQKLLDNVAKLKLSKELVTLMTDAPIDVDSIFEPRVPKNDTDTEGGSDGMETTEITKKDADTEPTKQTALAKIEHPARDNWSLALEPTSTELAWKMSVSLHESRLYQQFGSPQAVFAVVLRGRALGMDATTALDGFHVVEGRPTMSAPLLVGLVLQSGKADYFKCIESTDGKATYKTHRKGDPDSEPTVLTFTIDEAKQAHLVKLSRNGKEGNWHKRPKTMLRWRCATELARMVYPDVVAGLYTPDEISNGEYVEAEIVG
jgi:hypothetical protein